MALSDGGHTRRNKNSFCIACLAVLGVSCPYIQPYLPLLVCIPVSILVFVFVLDYKSIHYYLPHLSNTVLCWLPSKRDASNECLCTGPYYFPAKWVYVQ